MAAQEGVVVPGDGHIPGAVETAVAKKFQYAESEVIVVCEYSRDARIGEQGFSCPAPLRNRGVKRVGAVHVYPSAPAGFCEST